MKNSLVMHNTVRALPLVACALAMSLAAACGKNGDNSAVIKPNTATGNPAQAELFKTVPKFDAADAQNQDLLSRIQGSTAIVKPVDAGTDKPADNAKKIYTAKISFLVATSSGQSAVQVVAEGPIYFGQQNESVDDGNGAKKHALVKIKMSDESSPEATDLYQIKAVCKVEDCSLIHVLLSERVDKAAAAGDSDAVTDAAAKPLSRHTVAAFQRRAGAAMEDGLELIASAARSGGVDPKTGKPMATKAVNDAGIRTSFEDAKKNFAAKGIVSPSAKETPAAPIVAGDGAAAAAAPVAAPATVAPVAPTTQAPAAIPSAQTPAATAPTAPAATAPAATAQAPTATAPSDATTAAPAPAVATETQEQSTTATAVEPKADQK